MNILVEEEKIRIDQYLSSKLEYSRSKVQKLIKAGKVLVNEQVVSSNYIVKLNDTIDITLEEANIEDLIGEDIPIDVRYEDEYLLVINKQSGLVVHPAPGNYSGTMVNGLIKNFQLSNNGNRPGIVHRIDKDTSGLLVVAKNDEVHEKLSKMIKEKEVERLYFALVEGVIKHNTGTIDAPIGRDTLNRQKMDVTDINGKDAITHFTVVKRYKDHTLIECKLETGRTHQIRAHLKYIGFPIVNDPVYGKGKDKTDFGQLLHSKSIRFIHPITNKEIYIESELPKEFSEYLETLTD